MVFFQCKFVKQLFQFLGAVRKSLDISFVGETRDSERMYIADCKIEGVEEVVSSILKFEY